MDRVVGACVYCGPGEQVTGISKPPVGLQMVGNPPELETGELSSMGLDGRIFQDSTGGGGGAFEGTGEGFHQFPGELGSICAAGRTTSTIRGGGGMSGQNSAKTCAFTSSLRPQSNSPAPSSSNPSKAIASVRYTYLLTAWWNSSCSFLTCASFSVHGHVESI